MAWHRQGPRSSWRRAPWRPDAAATTPAPAGLRLAGAARRPLLRRGRRPARGRPARTRSTSFAERVGGITDSGATVIAGSSTQRSPTASSTSPTPTTSSPGSASRARRLRELVRGRPATTPDFAVMAEVDGRRRGVRLRRQTLIEQSPTTAERARPTRAPTTSSPDGFAVGVLDETSLVVRLRDRASRSRSTPATASRWPRATSTRSVSTRSPTTRWSRSSSSRRRRSRPRSCGATSARRRAQALEPLLGGALSQPIAATADRDRRHGQLRRSRRWSTRRPTSRPSPRCSPSFPASRGSRSRCPTSARASSESLDQLSSQRPARGRRDRAPGDARDRPRPRRGRVRLARRRGGVRRGHRGARLQRRR